MANYSSDIGLRNNGQRIQSPSNLTGHSWLPVRALSTCAGSDVNSRSRRNVEGHGRRGKAIKADRAFEYATRNWGGCGNRTPDKNLAKTLSKLKSFAPLRVPSMQTGAKLSGNVVASLVRFTELLALVEAWPEMTERERNKMLRSAGTKPAR